MNPFYKDYSEYLSDYFPGIKVQKISVNAGFSCPNRDGTIGRGGCIYCDNTSFTPSYCFGVSGIAAQLEAGKRFFRRKYQSMKFLAYFQSYTNTFVHDGKGLKELECLYREALDVEDVAGLVIGSRPDCFPEEVVELLGRLNKEKPLFVELGAESSFDSTLRLLNRGHGWAATADASQRLSDAGIAVGLHLIAGLPGEDEDMFLETVGRACSLPIDSLKLHHLQVIEGTPLHKKWEEGEIEVKPFDIDRYLSLCVRVVDSVPRTIAIERFLASSPPEKVVAPKWGIKNYEFTARLLNLLKERKNN